MSDDVIKNILNKETQKEIEMMHQQIKGLMDSCHKREQYMYKILIYIYVCIGILLLPSIIFGKIYLIMIAYILPCTFLLVSWQMLWKMQIKDEYRHDVITEYLWRLHRITRIYIKS